MITGTNERVVTIYTINDDKYTDFDSLIPPDNYTDKDYYNYSDDYDSIINDIVSKEKLYESFKGYYEHKVKIKLIYIKDYYHDCGYEYDMDFTYEIIESKETDYWDTMEK